MVGEYLLESWLERKKWEARLQAITLLNELNDALGGDKKSGGQASLSSLQAMGFKVT